MNENLKTPIQEIKEVIKNNNLNSTEVKWVFLNLIKEMELGELMPKICNSFSKFTYKSIT